MTLKTKQTTAEKPPRAVVDPLLELPIPHAYALIPHPDKPGLFYAVHLEGVFAEKLSHLEPSDRPSQAVFGLLRISQAMENRHRTKKWGSP